MTSLVKIKTLPFQVNQKIVDLLIIVTEEKKRHEAEQKASHVKLWDAVHSEYPELEVEADYLLNSEYIEQGIVMLKTGDKCKHQKLNDMLDRIIKDINQF